MYIYVPPWRPFRWLRWCKGITQKLLHRGARTHRRVYNTAASTQRSLHTQKLLYRGAFTHRRFYTENLLHREAFTHRRVYAQKVLHTEAFTQAAFTRRTLATKDLCNVDWRCEIAISHQFFSVWPSFRVKGLHLRFQNRNFTSVFWRWTLMSCERATPTPTKIAFHHASCLTRTIPAELRRTDKIRILP